VPPWPLVTPAGPPWKRTRLGQPTCLKGVRNANCSFSVKPRPASEGNRRRETVGSSGKPRGRRDVEIPNGESVSPNESEPDSASLHHCGWPYFQRWRSLPPMRKQRADALIGPSRGDWGERALKRMAKNTGRPGREPQARASKGQRELGTNNQQVLDPGVGAAHSSDEAG
jgi:hypothetical protein